jgi:hypothetical protein
MKNNLLRVASSRYGLTWVSAVLSDTFYSSTPTLTVFVTDERMELRKLRFSFVKHVLALDLDFNRGSTRLELTPYPHVVRWFDAAAEKGHYVVELRWERGRRLLSSHMVWKVSGFKEIAENLRLMLKKPGCERDAYGEITRLDIPVHAKPIHRPRQHYRNNTGRKGFLTIK